MNGNIGILSSREESSVSRVVDEGVPVIVHVNSESISKCNDVAVGRKLELHRELYKLCFA